MKKITKMRKFKGLRIQKIFKFNNSKSKKLTNLKMRNPKIH